MPFSTVLYVCPARFQQVSGSEHNPVSERTFFSLRCLSVALQAIHQQFVRWRALMLSLEIPCSASPTASGNAIPPPAQLCVSRSARNRRVSCGARSWRRQPVTFDARSLNARLAACWITTHFKSSTTTSSLSRPPSVLSLSLPLPLFTLPPSASVVSSFILCML